MPTFNDVLDIEKHELGYDRYKDPNTGTKYGRWYAEVTGESWAGENDVAYCVMFQSWCFAQAGFDLPFFPSQNCDDVVNRAKDAHMLVNDVQRGDLVIFDWGDGGILDHIGFVYAVDKNTVYTIEGNTLNGKVAYRERTYDYIEYIVRPSYSAGVDEWVYNVDVDKWWYRYADGSYPSNKWVYIDDEWYYFDVDGWMCEGFKNINNVWYYFNEKRNGKRGAMTHSKQMWVNQDGIVVIE